VQHLLPMTAWRARRATLLSSSPASSSTRRHGQRPLLLPLRGNSSSTRRQWQQAKRETVEKGMVAGDMDGLRWGIDALRHPWRGRGAGGEGDDVRWRST
jgi:hypothetical protein